MNHYLAFYANRCLVRGDLVTVALHLQQHSELDSPVLIFEEQSGRQIDVDIRGSEEDVIARYGEPSEAPVRTGKPGRPKLGVVGREVTLLPRHWKWLDSQRGGSSASLRRLVEAARKSRSSEDAVRAAQDRTNRFTSAIAGDLPGYEEATRALYASDRERFEANVAAWPSDIRKHTLRLSADAFDAEQTS